MIGKDAKSILWIIYMKPIAKLYKINLDFSRSIQFPVQFIRRKKKYRVDFEIQRDTYVLMSKVKVSVENKAPSPWIHINSTDDTMKSAPRWYFILRIYLQFDGIFLSSNFVGFIQTDAILKSIYFPCGCATFCLRLHLVSSSLCHITISQ